MDIEEVARFMRDRGWRLATAESCTAGLIAALLADVEGAGELLDCAFVAYSPQSKVYCLGVSPATLETHNLTSEPVACEMARGALARSRADVAIANTGAADDGAEGVPAGTQCFAWAFHHDGVVLSFSETRRFSGSRREIREAAARYALQRLPRYGAQLAVDA